MFVTVYEGAKSFYKESDETKPVNTYGETKVAAEKYIQSNYSHYAILRSSIIYGPQPFVPLPKTLPVQVTEILFHFDSKSVEIQLHWPTQIGIDCQNYGAINVVTTTTMKASMLQLPKL